MATLVLVVGALYFAQKVLIPLALAILIAFILTPLVAVLQRRGLDRVSVVILVIFMLLRREDLRNRVIQVIGRGRLTLTTRAVDEAGQRISRYLLTQLVINSGFGVAVTIGLMLIRVPYAPLWGILAGALR